MTIRPKVAVLYTQPETVLEDYERLANLAGMKDALDPKATTILKDNISWHYPFPSANTTPWQLEGTILALRKAGYTDLTCVQNETVVINAFKGEDLCLYSPIFRRYCIPVLYNFKDEDMTWVPYEPKGEMLVLHDIYPQGIHIPDYLFGKNIVHLPTVKCHIYTTTTGAMKNAFGGLLHTYRHYTHPEGDPPRHLRRHGRDDSRERAGAANHDPRGEERHPGQRGSGGYRCRSSEDDGLRSPLHRLHPPGP